MRTRVQVHLWGQMLFTALGLGPLVACRASVTDSNPTVGEGGSGTGGVTEQGGGGAASTASTGGSTTTASGGATGLDGASASGAGGSDGSAGRYLCLDSQPTADVPNGVERCQNGLVHRTFKTTCPSRIPRSTAQPGNDAGLPPELFQCSMDTECTANPHGYCQSGTGGQVPGSFCTYGCVNDDECAVGSICLCDDPVGRCIDASCTSDASCPAPFVCGLSVTQPGCAIEAFACQSAGDTCATNADCMGTCEDPGCTPTPNCRLEAGRRFCSPFTCVIGRPFLVRGVERVAEKSARSDWGQTMELGSACEPGDRDRVARAWTRIALMEHASIAAFARFTLQLLSLGAPLELVERSNAAQADETRHARLCFAIASAYGGRPVGPGPLRIEGSLDQSALLAVLASTIEEGCIGETIASLEAAEAMEHATDPAVREVLATIARDELRHAELAWRFLRWAIAEGGSEARRVTANTFAGAAARGASDSGRPLRGDERRLLAAGIVPAPLQERLRVEAMSAVVLPCAARLLESPLPGDDVDQRARKVLDSSRSRLSRALADGVVPSAAPTQSES